MKPQAYDSYPWYMVLIGVGLAASTYLLGAYILSGFGVLAAVAYLGFCAFTELSVLRGRCIHCYYYGKVCAFGRGRLCSVFFTPGDPRRFVHREVSIRDIVPDILVSAIPLLVGIVLLVRSFTWSVLLAMMLMLFLALAGNAFVRGSLACKHCAQREIGCPAEKFFSKQRV